jgi:hypothetical protein
MSSSDSSNVVPYPMTNPQFLEGLAGPEWGDIQCAYFSGNPQDPDNPCINWNVYPASTVIHVMEPHLNNYFCVSLPKPGAPAGRKQPSFGKMFVLVIDDVGKKVDAAKIEAILGPPSYILETSAGSSHWGWILEPITDHAWAQGMVQALYRAIGAGDNLVKLQTMVRLPCGTNGKYGSSCRLLRWTPNNRIRHSDWIEIERRIGAITPIAPPLDLDPQLPDPGEVEADTTLQALREHGDVLGNLRKTTMGYGFDVRCFNAAEHTDKRDAAVYVPISGIYKCLHGHCINLTGADLRAYADKTLREESGGLDSLARREFDDVDEATVRACNAPSLAGVFDPWAVRDPIRWPGGILPAAWEEKLTRYAEIYGYDPAALMLSFIGAGSAAADKRARFRPYHQTDWEVPPIIWVVLVAQSGSRKTAIWRRAMEVLTRINRERMAAWKKRHDDWHSLPSKERKEQPEPYAEPVMLADATIEALQQTLVRNPRGVHWARDEFSGLLDFDRYHNAGRSGKTHDHRALLLESYEGGSFTSTRVGRGDLHIESCGLTTGGGIQPAVLAELREGLSTDGLLQRCALLITSTPEDRKSSLEGATPALDEIDAAIARLVWFTPAIGAYMTDAEGEAAIRETEHDGERLVQSTDLGLAFQAVASKLHGLHARCALILHLLDEPAHGVIPGNTVWRAWRLVWFLLDHMLWIYESLPGPQVDTTREIASYLLRYDIKRLTTRMLKRNVAVCRDMDHKMLRAAIETLVTMEWLRPVERGVENKAWLVTPGLDVLFAERKRQEHARVEALKQAFNWRGRYRPSRPKD